MSAFTSLLDALRAPPGDADLNERAPSPTPSDSRPLTGGRASRDRTTSLFDTTLAVEPPPDYQSDWRLENLNDRTFDRTTPFRLIELMADLSPDVSRAIWDWLRLCNPGWKLTMKHPGSEDPYPEAQAVADAFLARLKAYYGSVDILIGRLNMSAFVRGAIFSELVLSPDATEAIDIAVPDPVTARFRRTLDPLRGEVWLLGQWQDGKFVRLDLPTVRYLPVDPFPGKPYGRSPVSPALFPTLFLIGLLHDLRRVIAQQGYPRIDVSVDLTELGETLPESVLSDPVRYKEWVDEIITEVQDVLSGLEPDDTYVHTSVVNVNGAVGTVNMEGLGAINGIVDLLERQAVRGIKSMPLMFGITDGVSEANANRQWEIFAAGVKAAQHLCESTLEGFMELTCRARGLQATAQWRFAELRSAELMRDAQTESIQITNNIKKLLYGWVSQEEAALNVTGHPPVLPEPLAIPSDEQLNGTPGEGTVPEPGADRVPPAQKNGSLPLLKISPQPAVRQHDHTGTVQSR